MPGIVAHPLSRMPLGHTVLYLHHYHLPFQEIGFIAILWVKKHLVEKFLSNYANIATPFFTISRHLLIRSQAGSAVQFVILVKGTLPLDPIDSISGTELMRDCWSPCISWTHFEKTNILTDINFSTILALLLHTAERLIKLNGVNTFNIFHTCSRLSLS